jgi:hypothetical protein
MHCFSFLSFLGVVLVLFIVTLAGTAMAQNCAPVFGGTDQDKLIEDIATCAKEVSDTLNTQFDAYLIPESCHIHISLPQLKLLMIAANTQAKGKGKAEDTNAKAPQQFVECMKQNGWAIPYNSIEFAQ